MPKWLKGVDSSLGLRFLVIVGRMEQDGMANIVERLQAGDTSALAVAFAYHRERLWRTAQFRMDRRLTGRVDADDVLQETYLNASQRIDYYLKLPDRSLFVWLRMILTQTLIDLHRRHLGAEMRDAGREISLHATANSQATSVLLAHELAHSWTSPSHAATRQERMQQLETAITSMSELDQEIIALRHFEDLSNAEVSEVLEISPTTASNRYVRALARLKDILTQIGWDEASP